MKKQIASSLVALIAAASLAAPALGETGRKTELVDLDGASVDRLQLRYNFDAVWVIDTQNILYRDTSRDHYLVTLKETCEQIDVRSRRFNFFPSWSHRLLADNTYEVQPEVGPECDVARVEQVGDDRANTLRDSAERRAW